MRFEPLIRSLPAETLRARRSNSAPGRPLHAGYAGLILATVLPDRAAHVAYALFLELWKRGYALEATNALINALSLAPGVQASDRPPFRFRARASARRGRKPRR